MRQSLGCVLFVLLPLLAGSCLLEQRTMDNAEDLPVGCRVDAECSLNRVCTQGFCELGCVDADDCCTGVACEEGRCVECDETRPCPAGLTCGNDSLCKDDEERTACLLAIP